ncbi:MAG TPA: porphobilinogen synthase, partial [Turneriella sp.]|nr:porphobilinogen synthase [Turneriella sp.]
MLDVNYLTHRPRRNRVNSAARALVEENQIRVDKLIEPLFLLDGQNKRDSISSMPGIFRLSEDNALRHVEASLRLGIRSFILFPVIEDNLKDNVGSYSYAKNNFYLRIIAALKKNFHEALLISDAALDPCSTD